MGDRTHRTARDWAADGALFAFAVLAGFLIVLGTVNEPGTTPTWLLYLDQGVGVLGCLALWWRRRFPLVVAGGVIAVSAFAESVTGAMLVVLFTVAVHRPARVALAMLGGAVATFPIFWWLRTDSDDQIAVLITLGIVLPAAVVGWGMVVRSRRQLVASLRERATAAEVEARLRADRVAHEARETLAREMHDVLGHRLSLLSVSAGALAYHREASADEVARAVEVIRSNAHLALQDLREVIGVLRAPVGEMPSPNVTGVGDLLTEADRAGTPVTLVDDAGVTTAGRAVPETAGSTLYRVVQEALTNVRKHAGSAPVVVRITGEPGDHLAAEIVNERPAVPAPAANGTGEGLRGLTERATLVGGRLDHGPTDAGGWRVTVRLPWPSVAG